MITHHQLRVNNVTPPSPFQKWNGRIAREVMSNFIAEANDQTMGALFHHSAKGTLIQSQSSIRFGGGDKGFSVTLINDIDNELKTKLIIYMVEFANQNNGSLGSTTFKCGANASGPVHYHARIVMGRSAKKRGDKYDDRKGYNARLLSDDPFLIEEIKWTITKGLLRQANNYIRQNSTTKTEWLFLGGVARPEGEELDRKRHQAFMDSIEVIKTFSMSPDKGYLPRFNVDFIMPYDFHGHWAVGGNNHSGHGQLFKTFKQAN